MVDFKKINQDMWDMLTPEEQQERTTYLNLLIENTFYETATLTNIEKDDVIVRHHHADVELIRRVNRKELKAEGGFILSFGGYKEYQFDQRFINLITTQLQENPDRGFYIDLGYGQYVTNSEMQRIIKEATDALTAHGKKVEADANPGLTNSEMGKMLSAMGLR